LFAWITKKYMACGRALLNWQDGHFIGKALNVLVNNVKKQQPLYNIHTTHREVLLDFDNADANAFVDSFWWEHHKYNPWLLCSFHAVYNACVKGSQPISAQWWLPDEPSAAVLMEAFDILHGQKPHSDFSKALPPDWWKRLQVFKKLFNSLEDDDWDEPPIQ